MSLRSLYGSTGICVFCVVNINFEKMKKIIIPIFLMILVVIGCDKMDCNGKLDGNWQLTEWREIATGVVTADNTSGIYYTVKLELMQFRNPISGDRYLAYFDRKGDSLIIGDVFLNKGSYDSIVPISVLGKYGDDGSGRFLIRDLSSDRLVLTNRQNRLTFRKY